MKKNSNDALNYICNTGYQILAIIMPLITAPYISRVLGANGVGQYSFTYSIVTYFVLLATLGTTVYGQREIAYNRDSLEGRSAVFWNVFTLRIIMVIISMSAYIIFAQFLNEKYDRMLLFVQALYIINIAIDVTWYFQGMANFVTITLRNVFIRILSVIAIFAFVKDENDVVVYSFILVFSNTLGLIAILPLLRKEIKLVGVNSKKILLVLKGCIPMFVPTIAVQIYTVLDKTMIGVVATSSVENGYYEQTEKIVKMTIVLITSLSTVLAPRIAEAYKNQNRQVMEENLNKLINYVCILGLPIAAGLFSISDYFIPFFLGNGYEKCILLMKVFSPIVIFIGLTNVIGTTYFVQTSQQKKVNISVIMGAIINLLLNIILIPRLLSIGAAIASVVAEIMVALVQIAFLKKQYNILKAILEKFRYVLLSILMMVIIIPVGKLMNQYSIENVVIIITQVITGVIIYFCGLMLMKDRTMLDIVNIVRRRKRNV